MSSFSIARQHIQRSINWPLYREHRAYLADMFPVIRYSGQPKRPLALGIRHDLVGANTGLTPDDVRHFLRAYTFGPKYLRALKVGNYRYALDGSRDGCVSNDEARHARLALQAHYADRERRRAVVRAVAVAVRQPDALGDGEEYLPYPYRFGRLDPNAFNPQREYPGSCGASSVEAA